MNSNQVKLSKFLSLVLRHKPETIGLTLDENGWTDVVQLIYLANKNLAIDRSSLRELFC
jgi:putative RNA 2'-phosphotransferase